MKTLLNISLLLFFLGFHVSTQAQTASDENNYHIFLESGVLRNSDRTSLSVQLSNGLGLSDIFYVGIGTGIDVFEGYSSIPVFLDVKASFLGEMYTNAWTPYYYVTGGHTFIGSKQDIRGGVVVETGLGLSLFAKSTRMAMTLKLGYRAQDIIFQENAGIVNTFIFRIGFVYR